MPPLRGLAGAEEAAMTGKHHVVVGSWEQGGRKGEPYIRMYEVRCDPCRWRSRHTEQPWQARQWAGEHDGSLPCPGRQWGVRDEP